jgi:hypothetical protein
MALVLVVETGAGLANANSYETLAGAETFFEAYAFNADWTGADALKTQAVVQASRVLDTQFDWRGRRTNPSVQAMQWPRVHVSERDRNIPGTEVPRAIKEATALIAMAILASDSFMTRDPGQGGADQIAGINLGNGALQVDYQPQSTAGASSNRYKTIVSAEVLSLVDHLGDFRHGSGMVKVYR